jgi:hypothetical protein
VFADPSLLDAIVLDQPAPCQDGDAGGSASSAAPEAVEGVLGESAADAKSAAIEPPLTTTGETTDAPLLQPAEAAVAAPHLRWLARSRVLSEERGHHPLACCCFHGGGFGPIQPATVPQEHDAPEGATRAASPEIQEVRENWGAALPRDVGGRDARALELARTPWTAAFEVGDDVEDDEEAVACNTLERGLAWACRAFDELILPTTSVSFPCASNLFPVFSVLPGGVAHLRLVRGRPLRRLVGGERAR